MNLGLWGGLLGLGPQWNWLPCPAGNPDPPASADPYKVDRFVLVPKIELIYWLIELKKGDFLLRQTRNMKYTLRSRTGTETPTAPRPWFWCTSHHPGADSDHRWAISCPFVLQEHSSLYPEASLNLNLKTFARLWYKVLHHKPEHGRLHPYGLSFIFILSPGLCWCHHKPTYSPKCDHASHLVVLWFAALWALCLSVVSARCCVSCSCSSCVTIDRPDLDLASPPDQSPHFVPGMCPESAAETNPGQQMPATCFIPVLHWNRATWLPGYDTSRQFTSTGSQNPILIQTKKKTKNIH